MAFFMSNRIVCHRFPSGLSRLLIKNYSSAGTLVKSTKDDATGIKTISMAAPPVNALNLELLSELRKAIEASQKDGSKAIILTSSLRGVFSAGLDIMEMYKPDVKRAHEFWTALQDCWITLYSCNLPVVAAINGSCPAGGCLMAMSCEYRVFVDGKHEMGLNETKLGIVAPSWFKDLYIATIGYRQAELALMRGSQFPPQTALKIGLVDEIAADQEELIAKCHNYIASYARVPAAARALAKMELRKVFIENLKNNREKDTATFIGLITQPKVQATLDFYIQMLKSKAS